MSLWRMRAERAETLLRKLEWSSDTRCPICHAYDPHESSLPMTERGHDPECELAAILMQKSEPRPMTPLRWAAERLHLACIQEGIALPFLKFLTLSEEAAEGLSRMGLGPVKAREKSVTLARAMRQARETDDVAYIFPRGKWATIQHVEAQLDELLEHVDEFILEFEKENA